MVTYITAFSQRLSGLDIIDAVRYTYNLTTKGFIDFTASWLKCYLELILQHIIVGFGRPFVKRFALCYRTVILSCISVLSVTLVYCGHLATLC